MGVMQGVEFSAPNGGRLWMDNTEFEATQNVILVYSAPGVGLDFHARACTFSHYDLNNGLAFYLSGAVIVGDISGCYFHSMYEAVGAAPATVTINKCVPAGCWLLAARRSRFRPCQGSALVLTACELCCARACGYVLGGCVWLSRLPWCALVAARSST